MTYTLWSELALVVVGAMAGFLNVIAGGGSLLTMPLMIFLGMGEQVANASTRFAILTQNLTAVVRYQRAGQIDWKRLGPMALPAMLGALLGASLSVHVGDVGLRKLLAVVMLGCALIVVIDPKFMSNHEPQPAEGEEGVLVAAPGRSLVWLVLGVIGFYGGLVQVGVGYLILFGLTVILKMRLLPANIMKVGIVSCYTPLVLAFFAGRGLVEVPAALCLALGQSIGAWLGAGVVLKAGAAVIRWALGFVVAVSGAKLLGWF